MKENLIDQSQINKIVENFGYNVSRLARRMISDDELAKDAAQEVWCEVIKSIDSFKGNSEISTWIYTIARRTILRYAKNERMVTHEDIECYISKGQLVYEGDEEKKEEWIKEKCNRCITAYCHCLKNESRLVFLFRENLGLSYKQVSEIMDLAEENVRKIASRSLKKIRHFLDNNCPLYNDKGTCGCRVREQVRSIDFDKKYQQLRSMNRLVEFHMKFDLELPHKNYWKFFLDQVVTK